MNNDTEKHARFGVLVAQYRITWEPNRVCKQKKSRINSETIACGRFHIYRNKYAYDTTSYFSICCMRLMPYMS